MRLAVLARSAVLAVLAARGPPRRAEGGPMAVDLRTRLGDTELPNPVHLGGISIRYYDPGTGGEEDE